MQSTTFLILTVASHAFAQLSTPVFPVITAAAGTLGLGAVCSSSEQCAGNAKCYGTTAFTIRTCGSFNAECTSDNDCATNTCQSGICSGFLASESFKITSTATATSAASSSTDTSTESNEGPMPAPSPTVVAPAGSLALGAECADDKQCAGGAECWASNEMLIRRCGNFNAACTKDAQCAYNSCNNGICNGFLSSSSSAAGTTMETATAITATDLTTMTHATSHVDTDTLPRPTYSNSTASTTSSVLNPPQATGGAQKMMAGFGVTLFALVIGVLAL